MVLRLVLMVMVAGTGLSVPSERDLAALRDGACRRVTTLVAAIAPPRIAGRESLERELLTFAEEPKKGSPVASETTESADRAFDRVMDEVASSLAADLETRFGLEDGDRSFAAVVDEMAGRFSAELTAVRAPAAPPRFVPMEVPDDLYRGVAYALNRSAEGIGDPKPGAADVPESTGNRFSIAVRLTREAVFAWARLLHGPAVVTISR